MIVSVASEYEDLDKKFKLCDGHISSLGHLCF